MQELLDNENKVVYTLLQNHNCSTILAWSFYKKHFLYPTPDTNPTSVELAKLIKSHYVINKDANESTAKSLFREWFRKMWNPTTEYPASLRGDPKKNDNKGKVAARFELKVWAYFNTFMSPLRLIKVGITSLPGLPSHHLGLYCDNDEGLLLPTDSKYVWGDFHEVYCTDEQWNKYSLMHSSCFEVKTDKGMKKYILSGPLSLVNHHCKSILSLDIYNMVYNDDDKHVRYNKNQEIFVDYGKAYFDKQTSCVCCQKE